eukprot:Mycagemm_TRINITY_DN9484_c0_g3::TRINITY_DN9484_c0_g3_i1::g.3072::m.3072 type:complete len:111 gc:universal TRINITY_DN9484_c0_g3_i1:665-333(-)
MAASASTNASTLAALADARISSRTRRASAARRAGIVLRPAPASGAPNAESQWGSTIGAVLGSVYHRAWCRCCSTRIAASAGFSRPACAATSTIDCSTRVACSSTDRVSDT